MKTAERSVLAVLTFGALSGSMGAPGGIGTIRLGPRTQHWTTSATFVLGKSKTL